MLSQIIEEDLNIIKDGDVDFLPDSTSQRYLFEFNKRT